MSLLIQSLTPYINTKWSAWTKCCAIITHRASYDTPARRFCSVLLTVLCSIEDVLTTIMTLPMGSYKCF